MRKEGHSIIQVTPVQRSLKEKQRQERERLILDVAQQVFTEKGYHDTSMDEIALRVGVAKGTVYLHFSSKEDLIAAIFTRAMDRFLAVVEETLASSSSPRTKLEHILHFMYSDFYNQRMQLFYSLYNSADARRLFTEKPCDLSAQSTEHKENIAEQWERLVGRITHLIEESKASGAVNTAIPTNIMVSVFFSLQSPRSYDRLVKNEHMEVDTLVNYLGKIFFNGIENK